MAGKAAIIVGHSHLSSVVLNLIDRPGEVYGGDESLQYFVFDTHRFGVNFSFSVPAEGENYVLNPVLTEVIDAKVPKDLDRIFVSMFGGNAHNALTLVEHPTPFDFVLPENPTLPLEKAAQLVTSGYIEAFINNLARIYLLNMQCLKDYSRGPVFHFESPPPVFSGDFILKNLEGYFTSQFQNPKIAPSYLRYKLWRMHSGIVEQYCEKIGINFIKAAPDALADNGFLPENDARDSTHAGPVYGGAMMRSLERQLDLKYGGWQWLY